MSSDSPTSSPVTPEALARTRAEAAAAPFKPAPQYNLGVMLDTIGDAAGAAMAYSRAAKLKPDFHQAWNNLGLALESLRRFEEAAHAFRQALAARPDYVSALKNLAHLGRETGDLETARRCYERLVELEPGNWSARLAAGLALPPVPASAAAAAAARRGYAEGLVALAQAAETPVGTPEQRRGALDRHTNFFLAYQGEDDRDLQAGYSRLARRLIGDGVPEVAARPPVAEGGRLRVGFASCFFRDCTVGHYFRSWVTDLDPARFEVWVFLLGGPEDAVTEGIRKAAARTVRATGTLAQAAQAIREARPEVLIYPEIGMNGRTLALAALRLAPVQCAGWGHPVTTGHAAIDFYLSCDAMEPPEAQDHYTERLVCLPGLGTRYTLPLAPETRKRADFGLPDEARLYFFPHAPYKVHPENDALVAHVLAEDAKGLAVLCEGIAPVQTAALHRRLVAAGVDAKRLAILPHLPRPDFLEAARLCDVMLDTTRWSGGNTTLDALAVGLPVVAWRGRFMRGRQSAGMLELIGVPELVADDADAYVARATGMARGRAERDALAQRIAAGRKRLFGDAGPVVALATFLRGLCGSA